MMAADHAVEVRGTDQVGQARRVASAISRDQGFGAEDEGRVALVVTEAATNLVKHGRGGHVLIRPLNDGDRRGVRVLSIDQGPGIPELARSLRDGFSSSGSPGTGLGAMSRQSDLFDLWTQRDRGTVVLAHLWPRRVGGKRDEDQSIGGVCVPMRGEEACGDDWSAVDVNGTRTMLVTDGLGHGPLAEKASASAREIFGRTAHRPPAEIVEVMNQGLRPTRGAAVAVVRIDSGHEDITFCGVGNIAGSILSDGPVRNLVSHHGTAGHDVRRIQEFMYPFPAGATLVLTTDGLSTRWEVGNYPGLLQRHPSLIASVIYRDFTRDRDDATVVVARRRS